jgi:hypothetical protein
VEDHIIRAALAYLVKENKQLSAKVDVLLVEINAMKLERKKDVANTESVRVDTLGEPDNQSCGSLCCEGHNECRCDDNTSESCCNARDLQLRDEGN